MQISDILLSSLTKYGNKTVLTWEDGTITYRQLFRIALRNAGRLKKMGVSPGDRVILCAHNGPHFLAGYFALQFLGAVPAPVNPAWKVREINAACRIIGSKWIMAGPQKYLEIAGKLSGARLVPLEIEEESQYASFPIQHRGNCEPGQIRFTSGTNDEAKAVLLSQQNLLWRVENMGTHCLETDIFLCPVAFSFRIMKILLAIAAGASIVSMKQFSIKSLERLVLQHNISWLWSTPAICRVLTDLRDDQNLFKKLRGVSSAGSFLPPVIQQDFQNKYNIFIYQHYGLSEGMDAAETPVGTVPKLGSVGKACAGIQLQIDRADQAQNFQYGEIAFRGPNVMLGYIKNNQVEPFNDDGWLKTGDLGYLDQENHLFVVGRKKELINVDGLKVSPAEVENVIYELPGVSLVKVFSLDDPLRGEVPAAYVVMKDNCSVEQAQIEKYCRQRLANFKVPRQIYFTKKIPITAGGKFFGRAHSGVV